MRKQNLRDFKLPKDHLNSFIGGCDSGVDPHLLTKDKLAWAVSSTIRGGYVRPMPRILPFPVSGLDAALIGSTSTVGDFITSGLMQGAAFYSPTASSVLPSGTFFTLISGRLFGWTPDYEMSSGSYVQKQGSVAVKEYTPTSGGNADPDSSTAPVAWLGQAEKYLIVQDGVTPNPIVFDGVNTFRSSSSQTVVASFNASVVAPVISGTVNVTGKFAVDPILKTVIPVSVYAGATPPTGFIAGQYLGQMTLGAVTATGASYGALLTPIAPVSPTILAGYGVWTQTVVYPIINNSQPDNPSPSLLYSTSVTVPSSAANSVQSLSGYVVGSMTASVTVAEYKIPNGTPYPAVPSRTGNTTVVSSGVINSIGASSYVLPIPADPYGSNSRIEGITLIYRIQSSVASISYNLVGTVDSVAAPVGGQIPVTFAAGATYSTSSVQGAKVFIGSDSSDPSNNAITASIFSYDGSGNTNYYLTNNSVIAATDLDNCDLKTLIGIPCGKSWAHCQGRIWTSLPDGRSFVAGDIVGGSSGTSANAFTDAILYTMQNTLLANGGTFSIPGNYGDIRAMVVAPVLNVALGQGPLQVLTSQCVFSVNAPTDITKWAESTSPIVVTSLIGAGGVSQTGSIQVNGDIIFRSPDGIRSLTIASLDFYRWNNTPVSHEVTRILDLDDFDLIYACSSCLFDNRVLFGCSQLQTSNGVVNQSAVVINLDTVSTLASKSPSVWEGVWEGLNALQFVTGIFGSLNRMFMFSSTGSGINFSEMLKTSDGQQVAGTSNAAWSFETSLMFGINESQGSYSMLRLENGEVYIKDIVGKVNFNVYFRADYDSNWHLWHSWSMDNSSGNLPYSNKIGLGVPYGSSGASAGNQNRVGYDFQVKFSADGPAKFMGIIAQAAYEPTTEFARPIPQASTAPTYPTTKLCKVFAGVGAPTTQNPYSGAGIYFDVQGGMVYLWLGTKWDGGVVPSGAASAATGIQAFCGVGPPTALTPTPGNNAGTYYDYVGMAVTFWNPSGYWGSDPTASGSGVLANISGDDYLCGNGAPPAGLRPANGAGIYYDLQTLTLYNWTPQGTGSWI